MPSYQIYIPQVRGADPGHLARAGCDVHDPKASVEVIEMEGPDGGRGGIFFWPDPSHTEFGLTPGYHPEQQEWTAAKASGDKPAGRFWMGREKDQPVEPEAILRKGWLDGTFLELGDGQSWIIPAAPLLPQKLGLDERGLPTRRVDAKYQDYWQRVIGYYQLFLEHGDQATAGIEAGLVLPEAWPFAVQTLALNYRVDASIVDWLGLLDERNAALLILRTFHGEQIRLAEALKKKESTPATRSATAGVSSSPGVVA